MKFRKTTTVTIALALLPFAATLDARQNQDTLAPDRLSAADEAALHVAGESGDLLPVWRESFGLQRDGARLVGGGPDYKARFTPDGILLTPALGEDAPRNLSVSFTLESIRRGGTMLHEATRAVAPVQDGNTALFARGSDVTERYEVLRDGVEQSFVFASRPPGQGDLVVSGRLKLDPLLSPSEVTADGIALTCGGLGGVHIGAVTGVDATGRTAPGSLRLDGDRLELSLPAGFVEQAAYPLVLDPLLGVNVSVASSYDEADPDVAYETTQSVYLVVWERRFSGNDVDIRGQRITSLGSLVGGLLSIESDIPTIGLNPTVASCNTSDRFVVAWQEGTSLFGPFDIRARKVLAASGGMTSATSIATLTDNETDPDAGGEASVLDDEVIVVWNVVDGGIAGAQVSASVTSAAPSVMSHFTLSADTDDTKPAISKSGGQLGRYLVAWERWFTTPFPGDHDIMLRAVDRNGGLLTSETLLASTQGPDEQDPDVDGDGSRFYVVYERESSTGDGDNDIWGRIIDLNGDLLVLGTGFVVEGDPFDDEVDPAVAFCGAKVFVVWSDAFDTLDYDIFLRGLNPATCAYCGPELIAHSGVGFYGTPELASQYSGSGQTLLDAALLVWAEHGLSPPFDGNVLAQRLEAVGKGGPTSTIGGGCGGGGTIYTSGAAAIANGDFRVRLTGADPLAAIGILNVASSSSSFACPGSTCLWLPFQYTYVATVSGGSANLPLPIPCMVNSVGSTFYMQWTVGPTAASPCSLGPNLSLSSRLAVTLGT